MDWAEQEKTAGDLPLPEAASRPVCANWLRDCLHVFEVLIVTTKFVLSIVLSAALFASAVPAGTQAGDGSAGVADKSKIRTKAASTGAPPSAQDIANAKSEGLVWVNLDTRRYHKDGEFYGKTKRGKFINEDGAKKEGFHEAEQPATSKKTNLKKPGDQSGLDATIDTHKSTPPKP
jgi:hypothetical protein